MYSEMHSPILIIGVFSGVRTGSRLSRSTIRNTSTSGLPKAAASFQSVIHTYFSLKATVLGSTEPPAEKTSESNKSIN